MNSTNTSSARNLSASIARWLGVVDVGLEDLHNGFDDDPPRHKPDMSQVASPLSDDLVVQLSTLITERGLVRAAKMLGVSRETLARIQGGLPVRPGSLALVRESLTAMRSGGEGGAA